MKVVVDLKCCCYFILDFNKNYIQIKLCIFIFVLNLKRQRFLVNICDKNISFLRIQLCVRNNM